MNRLEQDPSARFHVVESSGSATAVLASVGHYLACWAAGIRSFRSYGGVSGGAIVAALMAVGYTARDLLRIMLALDYDKYVGVNPALMDINQKQLLSQRDAVETRGFGVLSSAGLGSVVHYYISRGNTQPVIWPRHFWTMATRSDASRVIMKFDGVWHVDRQDRVSQVSATPMWLPDAIRMSCTIPYIFAPLRYNGKYHFDGALSSDGLCPVGVPIRYFGVDPRTILACHLGEDSLDPLQRRFHDLCRRTWFVDTARHWGKETAGVLETRPDIRHIHTVKYRLTLDEKWLAVLISFQAAVEKLALEGILHGSARENVRSLLHSLGRWNTADALSPAGAPQELAMLAEASFSRHGYL